MTSLSAQNRWLIAAAGVFLLSCASQAATVGQWNGAGSGQVWASSGNYSTIYSQLLVAPGGMTHRFESGEAITSSNLSNNSVFMVNAPSTAPTTTEIATLKNWVSAGGILLLFADASVNNGNYAAVNQILSGVGSGINLASYSSYGAGPSAYGVLSGTDAAVTGAKGGVSVDGRAVTAMPFFFAYGGSSLSSPGLLQYLMRYDRISLGSVYVFSGDVASNLVYSNIGIGSNTQFFLNLLAQGGTSGPIFAGADNPEPATVALTGLGLLGALLWRRRKV